MSLTCKLNNLYYHNLGPRTDHFKAQKAIKSIVAKINAPLMLTSENLSGQRDKNASFLITSNNAP